MPAMLNRYTRRMAVAGRLLALVAGAALAACDDGAMPTETYTPVVTSIEITDPGFVRDGDVIGLTAIVKDQRQRPMNDVNVQFTVSDPTVATVAPGNILTALREGTTDLIATVGTVQRRRPLLVVLHPVTAIEVPQASYSFFINAQQRIPTIVRGLGGRVLTGRPLTWESTNTAVVRVDNTGLVTAVGQGDAAIMVNYGTITRVVPVRVAGIATQYRVANVDGRPLPANVYEEVITRDDGTQFTLIERLEAGTVAVGDEYRITLTIAYLERHSFQGNIIERVVRRRDIVDEGLLLYNWLDASAWLQSQKVGGLVHDLQQGFSGPRVFFRNAGTNTIWGLGLRLQQ